MSKYYLTPDMQRLQKRLDAGIIRQVLLTGHPGTGKTSFAAHYAKQRGAQHVYSLCHHWVTDEHLFNVLDPAALAVGIQSKEEAWIPGILRIAAERSLEGPVVVCLDEIDKASAYVDGLLLDFLQTGRVPLPDHTQLQGCQQNLIVFLTSNGQRQLTDALQRRLYRFEMPFLPAQVEIDLLRHATGLPMPIIKKVVQMANVLRESKEGSKPSLSEMEMLLSCLGDGLSDSIEAVKQDVVATLFKNSEDARILNQTGNWGAMLFNIVHQEVIKARYMAKV